MPSIIILILLFTMSFGANAKILDKIALVVDKDIITLSRIKRIKSTIPQRRRVAPFIFTKSNYTNKEIVEIIIQEKMVRAAIKELGYNVSDDQIESTVNDRQKQLGMTREQLILSLKEFKISFNEYFELMRKSIEFNLFNQKLIAPMISISDQEIKNYYFNKNKNNKTLSFKYNLVRFAIPANSVSKKQKLSMRKDLVNFQSNGVLPKHLENIESFEITEIEENALDANSRSVLKNTDEGSFSQITTTDGQLICFFVKEKNLTESQAFLEKKNIIVQELSEANASKIRNLWYQREREKHFIKINI